MSLLFNMLSRLVILFLPRSKRLLISWMQSTSVVILEPPKIVCYYFHCFPIYCHEVMGPDAMILVFWMLSFKPTFSLFSSSSFSSIRVVSSTYMWLLIFLLTILIPTCASYSPELCIMFSLYKWNKQGNNVQPWHTPFSIWNQSVDPRSGLTVASWPVYTFLKRQVRWSGIPISFRIFHSFLWSTQSKALA